MPQSLAQSDRRALPVRAENYANANLRKAETPVCYKARVGATVERARTLRGWTLDELSGFVNRNSRQVARWISGDERAQFDALFAIDDPLWRNALVIAIAELGSGVEIDTVIRLRIKETA